MRSRMRHVVLTVIAAAIGVSACSKNPSSEEREAAALGSARADEVTRKPLYYRHPMNPAVTSPTPAKDEMGMDYLPVYADEEPNSAEVRLSAVTVQKLGVRTAPVEVSPLPSEVRAAGVVQFDARTVTETYAPTAGWIEKLAVRNVGQPVRAGQVLCELYAPSLGVVDAQYLQALASGSGTENPYTSGLRAFGLNDEMIADLREKRRPVGRIVFRAATSGTVTQLNVRPGALVGQGASMLQVAALDPIWIVLSVPASQSTTIASGGSATISVPGLAEKPRSARIDHVYPDVDPVTRALQVRLVLANRDGLLKPNMQVSAVLSGTESEPVLHVPREAVIRDGRTDRVLVALGEGRFQPRIVRLGRESGDRIVVQEGLAPTDRVVTSGMFLIDSESSVRSSLARMSEADPPQPPVGDTSVEATNP